MFLACMNAMMRERSLLETLFFPRAAGDLGLFGLVFGAVLLWCLRGRKLGLPERVAILVLCLLASVGLAAMEGARFEVSSLGLISLATLAGLIGWQCNLSPRLLEVYVVLVCLGAFEDRQRAYDPFAKDRAFRNSIR